MVREFILFKFSLRSLTNNNLFMSKQHTISKKSPGTSSSPENHKILPEIPQRKPPVPYLRLSMALNKSLKTDTTFTPKLPQKPALPKEARGIFSPKLIPSSNFSKNKSIHLNRKTLITQESSPASSNPQMESFRDLSPIRKTQVFSRFGSRELMGTFSKFTRTILPSLKSESSFHNLDYDDDDELLQDSDSEKSYDMRSFFDISLKLRKNIIKSSSLAAQNFPLLATVNAGKPYNFKKSPVDIICVIDKSGSMQGEKINHVRKALASIIELLDQNDRLSIISFNDYAKRETRLITMTKENKVKTLEAIKKIKPDGLTNIGDGVEHALRVLKSRRFVNNISGIFLLSDGLDKQALNLVKDAIEKTEIEENYTLHTFGFGNDHDSDLMTGIADLKDGNFYYIEDLKTVDQAFLNCLGSLAYSFAAEGELTITSLHPRVLEEKIRISRPMGDPVIWRQQDEDSYTARIGHIIANRSWNFVLKIKIPKNERNLKTDHEKVIDVARAVFKFKDLKGNSYEMTKVLSVHLLNPSEEAPKFKDDREVLVQYFRVKGYELMVKARKMAEAYNNQKALEMLMKYRLDLEVCIVRKNELIQGLIQDILKAQEDVKPKNFEFSGKHGLIAKTRAQGQEKYSFQSSNKFCSPGQQEYQNQARSILLS